MSELDEYSILHRRAQHRWHDDAYVIGSRQGLLRLRAAIDEALREGAGFAGVTDRTDERYVVAVLLNEAPPLAVVDGVVQQNPAWRRVPHTYTDQDAADRRPPEPPPWSLLPPEVYAARREAASRPQVDGADA